MFTRKKGVIHCDIGLWGAPNTHRLTNFGFDLLALKRAGDNFED
jgi:hypothetical protein